MQPRAWARLKLPFVAHGCNSARHYAVAAQCKKHGRKRLSEEELAEEQDRAKCMLHSRVTADATYGFASGFASGLQQANCNPGAQSDC